MMKLKMRKTIPNRIELMCSKEYARFRNFLQNIHTQHPHLYEHGYKFTLWLIDMLPILLSVAGISRPFMVFLLVLAFFFGTLLYGATLKNKYDKASEKDLNNAIELLEDQERELDKYKVNSSLMYYKLTKSISDGCSYMLQEGADKAERLLSDLASVADTIETTLTQHYKYPVSVNIKLVVSKDSVRTYARGRNNIANRGGDHVIFDLNLQNTLIANNYALDLITRSQIECFIEGDLVNMKTAFDMEDMFSCDRKNWPDYFMSTAIFAIRGRSRRQPHRHNTMYEVHGFICIDAKETNDWCKSEDCIVYTFGSFCANILYEYLAAYKAAS